MARITINTLVNQIKKVIVNKSSIPEASKAYVNSNGDIIASNYTDRGIVAFIAGVFADAAADNLNKLYSKDSLSLYTKTGTLVNGSTLPENCAGYFEIPEDNFKLVCTVTPETLKTVSEVVSRDMTRAYLTGFNVNTEGNYIEACDGFRAYREPINTAAHIDHDLIIPGIAASYVYKGNIEIAAGEKWARLTDTITGFIVYARYVTEGRYVNLHQIYEKSYKYHAVTVKDLESIAPYLKAACKLEREARLTYIRFKDSRLDYAIPALNVYGSLETDGHEAGAAGAYNSAYLSDAITAAGNTFVYNPDSMMHGPLTVGKAGGPEALLLPIRCDAWEVSDVFKPLDIVGNRQQEETRADNTETTPAPDPDNVTPEETKQEAPAPDLPNNEETNAPEVNQEDNRPEEVNREEAPDVIQEETTTPEAAAVAAINEKQNKDNHFVNISPEDVKRQQAITAAQAYYKALRGYKVSTIQAITAEAIYQANRDILQPIARRAGGLYIDNIAIIAAITAAADLYTLTEV